MTASMHKIGATAVVPFTERQRAKFLARLVVTADPNECWGWTGNTLPGKYAEYGRFSMWDRVAKRIHNAPSHRVAYTMFVGPIPPGMTIDHMCESKLCCRPSHLRALPHSVNAGRESRERTNCKRCGTAYTTRADGSRRACKECLRRRARWLRQNDQEWRERQLRHRQEWNARERVREQNDPARREARLAARRERKRRAAAKGETT